MRAGCVHEAEEFVVRCWLCGLCCWSAVCAEFYEAFSVCWDDDVFFWDSYYASFLEFADVYHSFFLSEEHVLLKEGEFKKLRFLRGYSLRLWGYDFVEGIFASFMGGMFKYWEFYDVILWLMI